MKSEKHEGGVKTILVGDDDTSVPDLVSGALARRSYDVLLMSNFPQGLLVLNEGSHFLAKPFIRSQLTSMVETLINPDKASRYASDLETAEMGDVKSPRQVRRPRGIRLVPKVPDLKP